MQKSIAILFILLASLPSNAEKITNESIENVIQEQSQSHNLIMVALDLSKSEAQ